MFPTTPCLVLAAAASLLPAQNQAIQLTNGALDRHVSVPSSQFTVPARGLTVETWLTYDDATLPIDGLARWPTVARQNPSAGSESWFLRVDAGTTGNRSLRFKVQGPTAQGGATFAFPAGHFANWTHVAGTYDGANITLFINGAQVATTAYTGGIRNLASGFLRIGNGDTVTPGREVWHGKIDELRIWPFARTQAEIQSTMNDTLQLIPGGVSFNFDGNLVDSSQALVGVAIGGVPFVTGQPMATLLAGGSPFGLASTTCSADRLDTSVGSKATAGNGAFSLICYDGAPNASGAVFLSATRQLPAFNFLGFDIYFGLVGVLPIQPPVSANAIGLARLPLGIPPGTMSGLTLHTQFVFLSPCGPQGLIGSHGLTMTVQ